VRLWGGRTCEPLVLGPALAIDKRPGRLCLNLKFSSTRAFEYYQGGEIKEWRTGEHFSEDGLSTSAIVTGEVSTLEHELEVYGSKVSG